MRGRLDTLAVSAETEWQRVGDALLAGICHTLNSRVTALWGVAELLAMEAPAGPVMGLFRGELQRLERLARLLHWLPRSPGRGPEPVSLGDLLPELVELHREHRGLERIEVELEGDPRTPPVRADLAALCRAVLLLLAGAARVASPAGGRIAAAYGPAGAAAKLTIRTYGAALEGEGEPLPELEAARRILDGAAEISVSQGGGDGGSTEAVLCFEVLFPAM